MTETTVVSVEALQAKRTAKTATWQELRMLGRMLDDEGKLDEGYQAYSESNNLLKAEQAKTKLANAEASFAPALMTDENVKALKPVHAAGYKAVVLYIKDDALIVKLLADIPGGTATATRITATRITTANPLPDPGKGMRWDMAGLVKAHGTDAEVASYARIPKPAKGQEGHTQHNLRIDVVRPVYDRLVASGITPEQILSDWTRISGR